MKIYKIFIKNISEDYIDINETIISNKSNDNLLYKLYTIVSNYLCVPIICLSLINKNNEIILVNTRNDITFYFDDTDIYVTYIININKNINISFNHRIVYHNKRDNVNRKEFEQSYIFETNTIKNVSVQTTVQEIMNTYLSGVTFNDINFVKASVGCAHGLRIDFDDIINSISYNSLCSFEKFKNDKSEEHIKYKQLYEIKIHDQMLIYVVTHIDIL